MTLFRPGDPDLEPNYLSENYCMATFRDEAEEFQRVDWKLLQNGAVTLYFRSQVLLEHLEWLNRYDYRVDSFECSIWTGENEMHEALRCGLEFPPYYGRSLDALNDCLSDLEISDEGGRVVVLNRYDSFAAKCPYAAWAILEIMERNSRYHLLFGRRLIVLVQSDDPEISFEPIAGQRVTWNVREWASSRRLEKYE